MASETFKRAVALIECDRTFDAIPLLNAIIEAEPNHVPALTTRARVRRRIGDGEGAITDYTQAIKVSPSAELYLSRALTWLEMTNAKGAIADSRQAIALAPENAGAHRLLGKALGLLGDGPGAIAAYKQAARYYINQADKANAQSCLAAIEPLKALPPLPQATDSIAKQTAASTPATIAPGVTVTTQNSSTTLASTSSPEDYVRLVQHKYDRGEYAAALKDLNWLLDIDAYQADALCLRGLIHAQLGRREQAVADLALAKAHHPNDPQVKFSRGHMRLIFGDGDGAVEEFSALIQAVGQPEDSDKRRLADYLQGRGDSYGLIGQVEQAFKDYSNAIALNPDSAELYERRAQTQSQMAAKEGAIADYQQAATLWLNAGNWQKHQQVVDTVRQLRSQTASSQTTQGQTVPIKTFNNHMPVVEVVLDGIATFDVVIDRNASHSIITRSMASRLNLEAVSFRYVYLADGTPIELPIGRLRSVGVGSTIVTDVYVAIAPDSATSVLGKDCFSAYSIRISGNDMTFLRR